MQKLMTNVSTSRIIINKVALKLLRLNELLIEYGKTAYNVPAVYEMCHPYSYLLSGTPYLLYFITG
jgi:hypothetical protein